MQSEYDNPLETFSKLTPSVTFNNKNRKQMEVARHFIALEEIDRHATNKLIVFGMLRFIKNNPQNKEINRITGNPSLMDGLISSSKEFITEDFIKSIHKTLATDLLPTDAGVAAGEYRIDERGVGDYTVKFPSPEIIESCMKNWVRQTNQTMQDVWNKDLSPYVASAKISHEFVWIHPFPDFNGRMSRLIMNLVLLSTGKIFSVDLRGESKNKHRYITSLKKANRQDYSALAALIAMRRSEVLENIKVNLMTAGYDFGADS
jgi:Fic family protein